MRQGHIYKCMLTWKQIVTMLNVVATCSDPSTDYSRKVRAVLHLPAELDESSLVSPYNLRMQGLSPCNLRRCLGHLQAGYNKQRGNSQRGVCLNAQRSRNRWCCWDTTALLVFKIEDIGVQTLHSITMNHSELRDLSHLLIPTPPPFFIQEMPHLACKEAGNASPLVGWGH